ncbi:MAG: sulfatase-like hydrolase/transferase, partial [Planctomycetota bacterium]
MLFKRLCGKFQLMELFVAAFLLSLWVPGCVRGSVQTKQTSYERPNILFIMSDDHAAHAISSYGSRINKTPNIDRLAKEGMRFKNSFCTNSICAPSRAVILTGKYSHVNGLVDNKVAFDGSQQTFPKLLQKNGYETAMIG